jgi:hypothetical protein
MREMIVILMTRVSCVSKHPHAFLDLQYHDARSHAHAQARTKAKTRARSSTPMGLNEWAALVPEIEMLTSADEHALCIGAESVHQITLVDRTTIVTKVAHGHLEV